MGKSWADEKYIKMQIKSIYLHIRFENDYNRYNVNEKTKVTVVRYAKPYKLTSDNLPERRTI